ncbi:uncharacterized protein LOC124860156 [Girardinichthys multiradiatus]|uniref:uncharacterized protein LOC124860156 n=1 Tax=Girardinichthys multiradiatus TaxID=208333 RepID=UPI001FADFF36|nr:uncharacterized protein LOC124860156 [Girardinichthys multiradiatus]
MDCRRFVNIRKDYTVYSGLNAYYIENIMSKGRFGLVARCKNVESDEIVALKVTERCSQNIGEKESDVLRKLREFDLDKLNVVRLYENFEYEKQVCMVFENLDISLNDYIKMRNYAPMDVSDIRVVAKQILVALDFLKGIGLTHRDVRPDNIMLVDRVSQPLRVKLIGFRLAEDTSKLNEDVKQPVGYRAPEVFLKLAMDEGVDMWGLGCSLAFLYIGYHLFPTHCEYECMRVMVRMFGKPEKYILDSGGDVESFFSLVSQNPSYWLFKSPHEYTRQTGKEVRPPVGVFQFGLKSMDRIHHTISPDPFKKDDWQLFLNLLKDMLHMTPPKRITPNEALKHDFITMNHLSGASDSPYVTASFEKMESCCFTSKDVSVFSGSQKKSKSPPSDELSGQKQEVPGKSFTRTTSPGNISAKTVVGETYIALSSCGATTKSLILGELCGEKQEEPVRLNSRTITPESVSRVSLEGDARDKLKYVTPIGVSAKSPDLRLFSGQNQAKPISLSRTATPERISSESLKAHKVDSFKSVGQATQISLKSKTITSGTVSSRTLEGNTESKLKYVSHVGATAESPVLTHFPGQKQEEPVRLNSRTITPESVSRVSLEGDARDKLKYVTPNGASAKSPDLRPISGQNQAKPISSSRTATPERISSESLKAHKVDSFKSVGQATQISLRSKTITSGTVSSRTLEGNTESKLKYVSHVGATAESPVLTHFPGQKQEEPVRLNSRTITPESVSRVSLEGDARDKLKYVTPNGASAKSPDLRPISGQNQAKPISSSRIATPERISSESLKAHKVDSFKSVGQATQISLRSKTITSGTVSSRTLEGNTESKLKYVSHFGATAESPVLTHFPGQKQEEPVRLNSRTITPESVSRVSLEGDAIDKLEYVTPIGVSAKSPDLRLFSGQNQAKPISLSRTATPERISSESLKAHKVDCFQSVGQATQISLKSKTITSGTVSSRTLEGNTESKLKYVSHVGATAESPVLIHFPGQKQEEPVRLNSRTITPESVSRVSLEGDAIDKLEYVTPIGVSAKSPDLRLFSGQNQAKPISLSRTATPERISSESLKAHKVDCFQSVGQATQISLKSKTITSGTVSSRTLEGNTESKLKYVSHVGATAESPVLIHFPGQKQEEPVRLNSRTITPESVSRVSLEGDARDKLKYVTPNGASAKSPDLRPFSGQNQAKPISSSRTATPERISSESLKAHKVDSFKSVGQATQISLRSKTITSGTVSSGTLEGNTESKLKYVSHVGATAESPVLTHFPGQKQEEPVRLNSRTITPESVSRVSLEGDARDKLKYVTPNGASAKSPDLRPFSGQNQAKPISSSRTATPERIFSESLKAHKVDSFKSVGQATQISLRSKTITSGTVSSRTLEGNTESKLKYVSHVGATAESPVLTHFPGQKQEEPVRLNSRTITPESVSRVSLEGDARDKLKYVTPNGVSAKSPDMRPISGQNQAKPISSSRTATPERISSESLKAHKVDCFKSVNPAGESLTYPLSKDICNQIQEIPTRSNKKTATFLINSPPTKAVKTKNNNEVKTLSPVGTVIHNKFQVSAEVSVKKPTDIKQSDNLDRARPPTFVTDPITKKKTFATSSENEAGGFVEVKTKNTCFRRLRSFFSRIF